MQNKDGYLTEKNNTETIQKAKRYTTTKNRLVIIESIIFVFFLIIIQISGISASIRYISEIGSQKIYSSLLIYGILFSLLYYVVTFYFNFYRGYVIEKQFGLSNQNLKNWLKDDMKQNIITIIVFLAFIECLYFFIYNFSRFWWLYIGIIWIVFTVLLAKLFPVVILPIFFKYEPLSDESFKKKIIELANKFGVKVLNVFKLKLSEKTKKANAALTGIGRTKRILLSDTLLENYSKDEIEVVIAHELAHYRLAHIWKMILINSVSTLFIFYMVNLLFPPLISIFGIESVNDIAALPSLLLLITLFGIILLPFQNAYSRKLEKTADYFAIKITGLPQAFINCMNKLSIQNLSDPAPSKFIEIILYDHPPISKRIEMAYNVN